MAAAGIAGVVEWVSRTAEPWSKLYGDHKAVSAAVAFFHLAPLIIAAGAAVASDRATLRVAGGGVAERARQLQELAGIHTVVLGGLALSLVSGVLLLLSDVQTFVDSVFLWIKLALVATLLLNGFLMTRTEARLKGSGEDGPLWRRLRILAVTSLILWLATTLAGVVLTEYA